MAYKNNKTWRKKNPEKFNQAIKKYYTKTTFSGSFNRGKPYTEEEDIVIMKHEVRDYEIHKQLGRSVKAIQLRRSNLKKLQK